MRFRWRRSGPAARSAAGIPGAPVLPYTLVLAAQALHAVGYAVGKRLQNIAETVVVYVGDGATSEGDMSEALNLAAVESASVLFICQNNGWAISKPSHEQMLTSIADRANGFGVRSWSISADDPDSTYLACLEARRHVESSQSPGLIELRTTRIGGAHHDRSPYRLPRTRRTLRGDRERSRCEVPPDVGCRSVVDDEWLGDADADVARARQELLKAFAQ